MLSLRRYDQVSVLKRCIEEQQEVHYTLAGKSEPDETAIFP
jgi:hypothetical protein